MFEKQKGCCAICNKHQLDGTGDFCKPEKAKQVLEFIKSKIKNKVLYGGSVNSKIAKDYTQVGFDGLLVGGASLDAKEFIKINKNA